MIMSFLLFNFKNCDIIKKKLDCNIVIERDLCMEKKLLRKKRMMTYFIDAAAQIIREEGIDKVTIRKVADIAGFNSATLYNYFENLDHLILFAAMRYIKDYAAALPEYLKDANNALDRFLRVWECFCHFSFKDPEIYHAIFFADLDKDLEDYVAEYYKLFSEELIVENHGISTMLLKHNIYERGMTTVKECVKEGFIRQEDANELNEMTMYIYESILLKVIRNKMGYDEAKTKCIKYIKRITNSFLVNGKI